MLSKGLLSLLRSKASQGKRSYHVKAYEQVVEKIGYPVGKIFTRTFGDHQEFVGTLESIFQKTLKACVETRQENYESPSNTSIREAYITMKALAEEARKSYVAKKPHADPIELIYIQRAVPRFCARGAMKNHLEVKSLCVRDKKEHKNHHGPTITRVREKYKTEEELADAAKRTNKEYDEKSGLVKPPAPKL